MRHSNLLMLLTVSVLALSACGSGDETGYLGSRDDIIVNNKGMPKIEPAVKMDAAEVAEVETAEMPAVEEGEAADVDALVEKMADEAPAIEEETAAKEAIEDEVTDVVIKETKTATTSLPETMAEPAVKEATKEEVTKPVVETPVAEDLAQSVMIAERTQDPAGLPMGTTMMKGHHVEEAPKAAAPLVTPPIPSSQGNNSPANAKPGECYAKVMTPAVKESTTEKVQISEEQKILARIVPAQYKITREKVLIKEARQYWKQGRGPVERVDQSTGEIMCLIEEPAEYKFVEKRELIEPEKPEYKVIPPQYEHVTKTKVIAPEQMEWRRILCDTNVTIDTIIKVQQALRAKGYNIGAIDGKLGAQTMDALSRYQSANKLAASGLSYETLEHMGVELTGI